MANEQFGAWDDPDFNPQASNSNTRKKAKKDPYSNPLGFTEQPLGITDVVEDILRQSRQTDRAIGDAAGQLKKTEPAVRIFETPVIQPEPKPVSGINPNTGKTEQTDNGANDGNRFRYKTKAYDTGMGEDKKRARDYEDSLKTDSGNEGYTLPPVQPSKGSESYPDENRKLQENAANEGYTIRSSEEYRQAQLESEQNRKNMTEFFGKFFQGNERENRFANGLPAEGEGHYSILGNYRDLKNKTDNLTQEDWGKSISNLYKSPVGQTTMDIYHSGGVGLNDIANGSIRGIQMAEPLIKKHYQWKISPGYTDPQTKIEYEYDPLGHKLYQARQSFREWSKEHEKARSRDYDKASLTNPGYIGVKGAGTIAEDIMSTMLLGLIFGRVGKIADFGAAAIAAMNGKGKKYDELMDGHMAKSGDEMLENPIYR